MHVQGNVDYIKSHNPEINPSKLEVNPNSIEIIKFTANQNKRKKHSENIIYRQAEPYSFMWGCLGNHKELIF